MISLRPVLPLAAASALAIALTGVVYAQDRPGNWFTRLLQPPTNTAVPVQDNGGQAWSGQPGASGDPRMTTEAIRAAGECFGDAAIAITRQKQRETGAKMG